jgi:hypothetical protein
VFLFDERDDPVRFTILDPELPEESGSSFILQSFRADQTG